MSAYVKLYCKKSRLKKNGEAPIYYVIKLKAKEKLLFSGKTIKPSLFDNESGEIKNKVRYGKLNSCLTTEKVRFNNIILDLEYKKETITFEKILSCFKSPTENKCFIEFFSNELDAIKNGIAKKTYKDYLVSLNNLKEYRQSLSFDDLDYKFLQQYEIWLKSVKQRNQNSRYHNFAAIRKFLNLARKYGYTSNYPFENFKFKQKTVEREYLTEMELLDLQKLYCSGTLSERLNTTLAHFLFTCYTGIAGDDLRHKERLNFNGDLLTFERGKTKKLVKVPLSNRAQSLKDKILNSSLKQSESRTNTDLMEIMKIAKINKHITYHAGRHTFAIISLMKGISLSVISKVLGHTSTKTTEIYAKVVDDLLNTEMSKWND
jgi:integrase